MRGFNQAERIASELSRRTGMRVQDCLRRRGTPTARQVGKGRAERVQGLAGAVEIPSGVRPPERVLLVDDVATTGGTLAACAEALYAAGAAEVVGVAYALTPGR